MRLQRVKHNLVTKQQQQQQHYHKKQATWMICIHISKNTMHLLRDPSLRKRPVNQLIFMPDVHCLSWSFLSGPYSWGLQKWTNMKTGVGSSFYGEIWREKSKSASLKRSSIAPGKTLPWSLKIGSVYKRVFKGATIQLVESQALCQWVGVSPLKKKGENEGRRESPSPERSVC